jgi:hypothetical protein
MSTARGRLANQQRERGELRQPGSKIDFSIIRAMTPLLPAPGISARPLAS